MLSALKFVQGAVARKGFVPSLTHFRIEGGKVKGYNGNLALCSPIPLDLSVTPKAGSFVQAIQTCKEATQLHMTPAGRLAIKSGKFRAYVECTDEVYPDIRPEGTRIQLNPDNALLPVLKLLRPFIAEDASRPWARGVLFRNGSAFATNNIILIEHWMGYDFPVEINLPAPAVAEIIRIGKEPTSMQVSEGSITFHYDETGRWLRSQVYTTQWPDVAKILDTVGELKPIPEGLFEALEDIAPFADDVNRCYFLDGKISTVQEGDQSGASMEVEGIAGGPIFHCQQLALLAGVAHSADFSRYPAPCPLAGEKLRGAIVGVRA